MSVGFLDGWICLDLNLMYISGLDILVCSADVLQNVRARSRG